MVAHLSTTEIYLVEDQAAVIRRVQRHLVEYLEPACVQVLGESPVERDVLRLTHEPGLSHLLAAVAARVTIARAAGCEG
jgi:hypothetical protein